MPPGAGTVPPGAGRVVLAVLAHPVLWLVAVRTVLLLAPDGWWRRRPYLPLPDPAYWHFRMVTAYGGSGDTPPDADDAIAYLRWCRDVWRRERRGLR